MVLAERNAGIEPAQSLIAADHPIKAIQEAPAVSAPNVSRHCDPRIGAVHALASGQHRRRRTASSLWTAISTRAARHSGLRARWWFLNTARVSRLRAASAIASSSRHSSRPPRPKADEMGVRFGRARPHSRHQGARVPLATKPPVTSWRCADACAAGASGWRNQQSPCRHWQGDVRQSRTDLRAKLTAG